MKKFCLFIGAVAIFSACNNESPADSSKSDSAVVKSDVTLPYPIGYSAAFEIGNADYTATVIQGSWKDWETNNLDNMKNWVADTITAFHSNGSVVRGVDSLIATWKRQRATYTTVIDSIDAVLPAYSTDKKENWVLVWAREINTKADGKKDTVALMETWRINKDGKADLLLQYERARRK